MKKIIFTLACLGFVSQALAADWAELDHRIALLNASFAAMQNDPTKCVPAEALAKAQGIVLLNLTKGGFGFAYQGGYGVAMVKGPAGNWSPAGFLGASQVSVGFQGGGEEHFAVILLMNTNATWTLASPTFNWSAAAQGTAGNDFAGVESEISSPEHPVLVYGNRNGLFGGVALKSGALFPDNNANQIYYGPYVTMGAILFNHQVQPTAADLALAHEVSAYAKR